MRYDVEQRTPEWEALRKGRLTGSDFASAAGIEGAYLSRPQLWRRMVGKEETRISPYLQALHEFGTENESGAIGWYECETGRLVMPGGFWVHDEHLWLGVSPDGLPDDGAVEAKCRSRGDLFDAVPAKYMPQCQGVLAVTGTAWLDFISYNPDTREGNHIRVYPDPDYWAWMLPLLQDFWCYVQTDIPPPRLKTKPVYQPRK